VVTWFSRTRFEKTSRCRKTGSEGGAGTGERGALNQKVTETRRNCGYSPAPIDHAFWLFANVWFWMSHGGCAENRTPLNDCFGIGVRSTVNDDEEQIRDSQCRSHCSAAAVELFFFLSFFTTYDRVLITSAGGAPRSKSPTPLYMRILLKVLQGGVGDEHVRRN